MGLKALVKKFLETDTSKRLGNMNKGVLEIKQYAWFNSYQPSEPKSATSTWHSIYKREFEAPFKPPMSSSSIEAMTANFDEYDEVEHKNSATDLYAKEFSEF